MISLIVCSKEPQPSGLLKSNIATTIGYPSYEIIWIDSTIRSCSIFEAYKEGVQRSKGQFLVFMHDDIVYKTENWGLEVEKALCDTSVGLLGVMGSHLVDKCSLYYHEPGLCRGRILQGYRDKKGKYEVKLDERRDYDFLGNEVVAIDGMWMATRRELFEQNVLKWDTSSYKGFHFYDMDISMQVVTSGMKILIMDNLLIEHKSPGAANIDFYDNCLSFHRKWNFKLPIYSGGISDDLLNSIFIKMIERRKADYIVQSNYHSLLSRLPCKILTKLLLIIRRI